MKRLEQRRNRGRGGGQGGEIKNKDVLCGHSQLQERQPTGMPTARATNDSGGGGKNAFSYRITVLATFLGGF